MFMYWHSGVNADKTEKDARWLCGTCGVPDLRTPEPVESICGEVHQNTDQDLEIPKRNEACRNHHISRRLKWYVQKKC
jgi:hypothetical protein